MLAARLNLRMEISLCVSGSIACEANAFSRALSIA
jgi:hypothetical protein